MTTQQSMDLLQGNMRMHKGAVVAFSGGVDSTVVLLAALQALGPRRVVAFTADSPSLSRQELDACQRITSQYGILHDIVQTHELELEEYKRNDGNRCYHCKSELYSHMALTIHCQSGFVMMNGSNTDDLGDYRPGMRAAMDAGVRSPLLECGFGKSMVRELARLLALEIAEKPASPCLASRIPYHSRVDRTKLRQVEQAEDYLKKQGFREVRVRHLGKVARIEVPPSEIPELLANTMFTGIHATFHQLGFERVEIDSEGLISGKLNRALVSNGA